MRTTTLLNLETLLLCVVSTTANAQTTPGTAAFQRLDKNGDGKITRDEAPNAEGFAAADANRDGAVTPEEFVRYLAARRRTPATTPKPVAATPAPVDGEPVLKSPTHYWRCWAQRESIWQSTSTSPSPR